MELCVDVKQDLLRMGLSC